MGFKKPNQKTTVSSEALYEAWLQESLIVPGIWPRYAVQFGTLFPGGFRSNAHR